ncbi:MAG: hypothetical protein JKY22_10800 [Flavobacteriaceae bacterium]|nr:hypothetical protein [Flavobacteriaceae bacterium]
MKNIFKIIAVSFVMLIGTGTMSAQGLKQNQNKPEVIAKTQTAKLSQELVLNGNQQRAVFRALVTKESNYKKQISGKDMKNAAVRANKSKIDNTLEAAMKKTLTADQYKKWLTLREQ